jgi:hypothetical protein
MHGVGVEADTPVPRCQDRAHGVLSGSYPPAGPEPLRDAVPNLLAPVGVMRDKAPTVVAKLRVDPGYREAAPVDDDHAQLPALRVHLVGNTNPVLKKDNLHRVGLGQLFALAGDPAFLLNLFPAAFPLFLEQPVAALMLGLEPASRPLVRPQGHPDGRYRYGYRPDSGHDVRPRRVASHRYGGQDHDRKPRTRPLPRMDATPLPAVTGRRSCDLK